MKRVKQHKRINRVLIKKHIQRLYKLHRYDDCDDDGDDGDGDDGGGDDDGGGNDLYLLNAPG